MRTFITRPSLLLLPFLLLALLLAACGGDDDDSADDSNGGATAEATADSGDDDGDDGDDDDAEPTEDNGDDGGGDGGDDSEACSLVTPEEINEVTGSDYAVVQAAGDQCTYEDSPLHGIYIILQGESSYEVSLDALGGEEFDGPGDRSAWAEGFYTLDVLDGDRTITVQVVDFSGNEREQAIAIAEKILD